MIEITLEELYWAITHNDLRVTNHDGETDYETTHEAVSELLTDLKKLGYKIVKE